VWLNTHHDRYRGIRVSCNRERFTLRHRRSRCCNCCNECCENGDWHATLPTTTVESDHC